MEQYLWNSCQQSLNADKPPSLQVLVSIRSLIVNPHTSNSTLSSILETLTRLLSQTTCHHTLKLLTDLASFHRPLSPLVFQSIHSNSVPSAESAAESVAALSLISDRNPDINAELDDRLFLSLCFCPSISQRLRLLRNAEKLGVRPHVLLTVLLGLTKDPYPYVRKEALNGLVGLCKYGVFQDRSVIEGCYYRGVELLKDAEDCVRSAAVRLVSEWGQVIIAVSEAEDKRDWSDTVFTQLCSVVRDMSLGVRVEAFNALGKIKLVSEDILLQILSKKVLPIMKVKKSYRLHIEKSAEIFATNASGAFVHGLEDEYHEVRQSACSSFRNLIILSAEFADRALDILMDILNDNSLAVRLEVLDLLHLMAISECLNVKEIHMHMFVGTLIDNDVLIRSTARKIFKLVRLPNLGFFRLCVDGLLQNLEKFPQDEADVFSVLFHMGRSHGKFAASIINDVAQEIEPVSDGSLGLDSARVAAFLVLSISVPLSRDHKGQIVLPRFFSYAVTLLGRISSALGDIMDQNTLLAYLIRCSRSSSCGFEIDGQELSPDEADVVVTAHAGMGGSNPCALPLHQVGLRRGSRSSPCGMEVEGEDFPLREVNFNGSDHAGIDGSSPVSVPLHQIGNGDSEIQHKILSESADTSKSQRERRLEECDQIREAMNYILATAKDIWLLVQSRCINEALKTLRMLCKEELVMFTSSSPESCGALAFTEQYLKIIKLLAKTWGQIVRKVQTCEVGELELLLQKLERKVREMRCLFIGFSKEEELHLSELTLVAYILRLSKFEICCHSNMKKLSAAIAHMEFLHKETSTEVSDFVTEAKNTLQEITNSVGGFSCSGFIKLVNDYSIKKFSIKGEVRHIYGTIDVADNDSEHPLPFVPGLPAAIPLEITLHNVSSQARLWLSMKMDEESIQFVSLDLYTVRDCNKVTKFNFVAPFYRTKAVSFRLRVSIGIECIFEDIHFHKSYGGPMRPLVYLCPEKEVHLYAI